MWPCKIVRGFRHVLVEKDVRYMATDRDVLNV